MRRFLGWISCVHVCFLTISALASPMTVIIDPGHGGRDKGATRKSINESDITLKVGHYLHDLLKKDRNFRPILSRNKDHGLSLSERAHLAKRNQADLLLSIHVNSNPDSRARGAEFYFQNQLQPDEESMFLAHRENSSESGSKDETPTYEFLDTYKYPADVSAIVTDLLNGDRVWRSSNIVKALKANWRGFRKGKNNSIRQAPFFVLSNMTVPSTLVELGFLTNPEDFADLTDDNKLKIMAEDLYRGLKAYKDSMDKAPRNF